MNRRAFLAAAPAVALAGPVAAETETPVAALFREWERHHAAVRAADAARDYVAEDQAFDDRWAVEQVLIHAPSQCERDVLLKILAWTAYGETELEAERNSSHLSTLWAEARALVSA